MTPPPMITMRARSGSSSAISVLSLHVVEQLGERGSAELGAGGLVLRHAPRPEIEVDLARGVLDGGPQRPAVVRHQTLQPGAGDPVAQPTTVVGRHQLLELVEVKVAFAGDVAQFEAGIVVA